MLVDGQLPCRSHPPSTNRVEGRCNKLRKLCSRQQQPPKLRCQVGSLLCRTVLLCFGVVLTEFPSYCGSGVYLATLNLLHCCECHCIVVLTCSARSVFRPPCSQSVPSQALQWDRQPSLPRRISIPACSLLSCLMERLFGRWHQHAGLGVGCRSRCSGGHGHSICSGGAASRSATGGCRVEGASAASGLPGMHPSSILARCTNMPAAASSMRLTSAPGSLVPAQRKVCTHAEPQHQGVSLAAPAHLPQCWQLLSPLLHLEGRACKHLRSIDGWRPVLSSRGVHMQASTRQHVMHGGV